MRLCATSIDRELGDALRRGAIRGSVLSSHRKAAYLEADGGSLIVLAREEVGNGPGFALLPSIPSFAEGPAALFPAEPFEARGARLIIAGGRMVIDAADASAWDPSIRPRALGGEIRGCVRKALDIAQSRRPAGALGSLIGRIAGIARGEPSPGAAGPCGTVEGRIRALARALASGKGRGVAAAAGAVVGLGEGLTPSCDDMLVGVAGIFHGISGCPLRGAWARGVLGGLHEAMGDGGGRTTPVSAHFLRAASRGRFTERAMGLIEAVLEADEKRVEAATERVLEYGATSGADTIVGIALAGLIVSRREKEGQ